MTKLTKSEILRAKIEKLEFQYIELMMLRQVQKIAMDVTDKSIVQALEAGNPVGALYEEFDKKIAEASKSSKATHKLENTLLKVAVAWRKAVYSETTVKASKSA